MVDIIKNNKQALTALCQNYGVKTMHIFGSASTDQFNESSDIDILVSFKEMSIEQYTDNYFNLHEDLEKLFSRKVDLITERSLSNPFFIEGVEKTKQLFYAA
ncbi:nucleotidyltransferase family protein [Echinicola salinicaeni]|uniref:nucleotidyltransferase family protein n=1 Tax=Echinicola salinicaeni TaxID=2762757 RepID=UPI00164884EE|nr:nucleotidyltransferase domain-containing protein [Echinicola salinicaeni]